MLTIFSCPKAFKGHIGIIQRNAIQSWTLLRPKPEIILIGDEEGTAEICREFGLRHLPGIERNERGIPLVNAIFREGVASASNRYVCYVNADILLLNCFLEAVSRAIKLMAKDVFLIIGRRWDLELGEPLNFKDTHWDSKLRIHVRSYEKLGLPTGIDYFFFPKGLWKNIPPFTLGRCHWDNWLVYDISSRRIPVIDITAVTTVIHQKHDYSHIPGNTEGLKKGIDMRRNWELQGRHYHRIFNIWDSSYLLLSKDLKRSGRLRRLSAHSMRIRYFLNVLILEKCHPYSLPLVILLGNIKSYLRSAQRLIKNKKK